MDGIEHAQNVVAVASSPTPDHTPLPVPMPIRRSTRSRRSVPRFEDEEFTAPKLSATGTSPNPGPSSRPKRKAALEAARKMSPETLSAHRELLGNVLAAMKPDEHKDFAGWVELESDPAFFNEILISLGAPGLQISEVFGVDAASLALLPTPVYGLVFLYEYNGEEEDEAADARQDCPDELWFGNQTTANACATVAMFNILMNVPDPSFGPQLAKFKAATTPLSPPHRGHKLDENDFIRAIHNSVARRLDLWSEDLLLDNKFEAYVKQRKRKTGQGATGNRAKTAAARKKQASRRKKKDAETANHYIAYVPVAGQVWELDGLQTKPACLGSFEGDDWLPVAAAALAARMAAGGSFNLLAVVPSVYERAALKRGDYIPASHALLAKLTEKGLLEHAIASST